MKILAIGDFHGKFPKNFKKEAKNADIILALGDYANADKIRKLIFKHWTDLHWYEAVGMKKARQMEKESFDSGLRVLKELNSLGKPVYLIWGNTDFYRDYRFTERPIFMPGFYEKKIKKFKNLIILDKKKKTFKNLDLIGHGGYLDITEYVKRSIDDDAESYRKRVKRYRADEKRLKKIFSKAKPKNNAIFVFHYTPYGYFDKIAAKNNPMHGKHVGWEPYNKIIKKYRPSLVFCGHMHEYQSKKKLGKSLVVNPGYAGAGRFAIVDSESLKVRFYR